MARFGLIGKPISHSKSPALFGAAYSGSYSYELIEAETLKDSLKIFFNSDFEGINVTSPYKDEVMAYVTQPDRISSLLGSANVLLKGERNSGGKFEIYSYNTDYYGVKNTIEEFLAGNGKALSTDGEVIKNVLVVGAGGAGKAAALAMSDMGYNLFLANRSAGKVAEFASRIGAEYVALDKIGEYIGKADIIIYSLSFLIPGFENVDLSEKILFEANYAKPSLSPECGVETKAYLGGRLWLYHQAVPAFQLFTGREPNLLLMRKIMGIE